MLDGGELGRDDRATAAAVKNAAVDGMAAPADAQDEAPRRRRERLQAAVFDALERDDKALREVAAGLASTFP